MAGYTHFLLAYFQVHVQFECSGILDEMERQVLQVFREKCCEERERVDGTAIDKEKNSSYLSQFLFLDRTATIYTSENRSAIARKVLFYKLEALPLV